MTEPTCPDISAARTGRIVHISADVPDALVRGKTRAIESLIGLVDERFDQEVLSLNRISPGPAFIAQCLPNPLRPRLTVEVAAGQGRVTPLRYHAPGRGLFHAAALARLGDWLADRLAKGPRPALLVGHKLSVEGLAVRRAARLLGVPYALSIQGDTDLKITTMRPDLRPALARCFHEAAMTFPFAPWALTRIEALLGPRTGPSVILPCPGAQDHLLAPRPDGDGLMTAFHLQNYRRKNLPTMATALGQLGADAGLAVIGGGNDTDHAACMALVRRHPGLVLEGAVPHHDMANRMNRASGFVLPSLRESFGLVFIEALFAGTPIIYPASWAVDGYLDEAPFALRVDGTSVASVAEAMARLLREENAMKQHLARWQGSVEAHRFRRNGIAEAFAAGLSLAMATDPA